MFDRLIESEAAGADSKNRRGYFMVSTVVVGILFLSAVVISIYAEDFGLGTERIEYEAMLAPSEMAAPAAELERPRNTSSAPSAAKSDVPIRTENMSRTDEPTLVPTGISTEKNTAMARPIGDFKLGNANIDPIGNLRNTDGTEGPGLGKSSGPTQPVDHGDPEVAPPPAKVVTPEKPRPPRTLGVVNGMALSLPKPVYSAAAIAIRAEGAVNVQVSIDETGKVVSANALNGHPILRKPAEDAARKARFTPTLLSKVPVKVTGTIVYNFTR